MILLRVLAWNLVAYGHPLFQVNNREDGMRKSKVGWRKWGTVHIVQASPLNISTYVPHIAMDSTSYYCIEYNGPHQVRLLRR